MADQVFNVTIKGIGDFSDVVSNVNSVQKALTKLKIPDKLGSNLNQNISNFMKEYDKYQQKIAGGIKTQGDNNAVNKSLSSMLSSYQKIVNDFNKIKPKDFKEIFKLDEGAFASITNKINTIKESLKNIKIDPSQIEEPLKKISSVTRSDKIVGKDGLLNSFKEGLSVGGVDGLVQARKALTDLENHFARFGSQMSNKNTFDSWDSSLKDMRTALEGAEKAAGPMLTKLAESNQELNAVGSKGMNAFRGVQQGLDGTRQSASKVVTELKNMHSDEFNFNKQVQQIDRQIQSYFGLSQMIRKVGQIARDAFNTVKELDQAMTATAVVTRFNVSDMWDMLPTYTEQANKLGATIKDVYDAATLYYQQGLNTNQAMGLANETLKMARIAGMDAAEATDMMTAALRGFNMEINQASAQKVNDIYSQLAAVTASDTKELGTAMEKTASLANSANMDIETTSAFLAQMIETTREAPENLGTAMKTIIARFQEMKKDPTSLVDAEGVAMDVNKVDTALKSIGVQLTNSKGEFRDLDDVFLDISKRWDSLSQGQQRYIATTAAGSRQQSRFIAMMSNYDRTMELVNEANNSAGASQKQFEKTMDSMSSKLNQLKNAWDEFTMGLMNNQILKAGVTGLTGFFTVVNKIVDVLGRIPPKPFEGITKSALTLAATLTGLNFGKKMASGSVAAGVGWWNNEGSFRRNFMEGYGTPKRQTPLDLYNQKAEKIGLKPQEPQVVTTDITIEAGNIDTSSLDASADSKAKEEIENGPPVVAKKDIVVDPVTRNGGFTSKGLGNPGSAANPITPIPTGGDTATEIDETGEKADNASKSFTGLGSSIASAGYALQMFGDRLGPLGGVFSMTGSIMMRFGTTLGTMSNAFMVAREGGASLGKALLTAVGPMAIIIASAAVLAGAIYLIDKAIETDAEKIERLTESANTASEAYSSLKQEASELKDSLEQIKNNEESFDGLVAGTIEFNEKLTETNQKIDELLQKYPELNEYLTVDKNGLKHISQEGIDFIKKQQDQLVGNASAQNILQNAYLKNEQDKQRIKQNEKEIRNIKYVKTDPVYGTETLKTSLTAAEQKRIQQLEEESKYIEENIANNEKIATQQALAAKFTNIEASDRERIASMYVDSYEALKKKVDTQASEAEMLKAYADYYGYQYDAVGKKVLDAAGEEKEIDKEALKGFYADIVVTADIQASAESLDKIENDVNKKFSKGLELGASSGDNILSGVLAGDVETDPDLVRKLAEKNTGQIEESLKNLSDAEMAALMGIKEEEYASNRGDLRKEFAEKIGERAEKTLEAQGQIYEDLGAKMAKARGLSIENENIDVDTRAMPDDIARKLLKDNYETRTQNLANRIKQLTVEQANILNNVAEKLEENVGLDSMNSFINKGISIYKSKDSKLIKEFNNLLSGIDWESPSSRLAGYTKAVNSSSKEIQEFGEKMKGTTSEANILGESFDEFVGGDWLELKENIDDFQNSVGEIDGAGILKAAEQSSDLKNLLDSGAVSATGVAMALQGIEEGKYSIGEVDGVVLQLISSLNRLEDASLRAHNTIANFDPGIDTGEGEDFVKDNAKKAQEYYDNGEWGNQQLETYLKLAAGEENWNKALKKHKGDLHGTTEELMKYINAFKDGFVPAWKQIYEGKSIDGASIEKRIEDYKKIDENLAGKFEQFKVIHDGDNVGFNIGDLSTKELKTYFEEIYGVSEQYADLMLQNLLNYSGTLKSDLQKNDLTETIGSTEFQNARGIETGNGKGLILTDAEIKAFKAANGDLTTLARSAGYEDKKGKDGKVVTAAEQLEANQFRVYKKNSDKRRTDYGDLLRDYADTFKTGQKKVGSLFGVTDLQTHGKLDLNKLIADTQSKSFDEEQSMRAAYKAYRIGQRKGESTLYEGMDVESGITNFEDFKAALEKMTETSQWVQVGETIGQQIVNALQAAKLSEKIANDKPIKEAAFTENESGEGKFEDKNFSQIVDGIAEYTSDKDRQQQDIATYLSQSADIFKNMSTDDQAKALDTVVTKLSALDFKPEEITKTISDGLGVYLTKGDEHHQGSLQTDEKGDVSLNFEKAKETLEQQLSDVTVEAKEVKVPDKPLKMDVIGNLSGLVTMSAAATGQNNPNSAFHRVGTMARGSRRGYTISGRPTLTGEEGEELVWEPKQNKAYMVGSKGPQFANISKDAVVWNADQTKRIKKNSSSIGRVGTGARGITPLGTMAGGNLQIPGTGSLDIIGKIIGFEQPEQKNKEQVPTIETTVGISGFDIKDEVKTIKDVKAEAEVNKVNKKGLVSGEPVKLSGIIENITVDKTKKEQPKKETKTTQTIETTVNTDKAQSKINSIKRTNAVTIDTKANTDPAKRAIKNIEGKSVDIRIYPRYEGTWEHTVKAKVEKAPAGAGSSAKGRYGTVGPDDKGGLTLTGEKGFEIAWLPSENRSMILGAGGPQMVDLPADAVIYTHEQSKDIVKRKGIPAGSHAKKSTTGMKWGSDSSSSDNNSNSNSGGTNKTNNDKKQKPSKKDDKKDDKKEKANTSAISKIIVWWDNITRRADATQRKADKNQKTYEKYLKDIKATLKDTGTIGGGNDFISNTNKAINLYNDQLKQAAFELRNLTIGTEGQRNAAKTKTKKDDKKANKRAFLNEAGGAVKISYSKKSGKKKKTVNQIVDTAKYIKEQDGTYIIDQSQLNKIKNSEKRKALADALNKEINDRISKKNAAEDNIEKANEALEKFSEELYNTFFAWENELTKIWNITQKIEQAQSRMSMNDAYDELLKAQLSTGKLTAGAESRNKDLTNFRSRLESQNDLLKERQEAITESQNNLRRILNSEDEKQTLTKVNDKLNATQKLNELNNAKQAKQAYDNAITSRKTTQDNISKIQAKITKLKDKKNLSKADKQEIEKLRKQRDNLKKQKENYDKIIKDNKALAGKVNQLQQEYNNVSSNALNETQKRGYEQYQKELTDQITAQDMARKYTDVTKRANGTIDIQFNTEAFEDARLNGNITNDMAKAVQDWVKKLQEATANLQQNYEDLTKEVTEYYTQLESLQDEWADYGKELTEIVESYEKEQIDKIKQLSDEIKKTLDKLLNEVKRNLDERRRQEENAKTERDISQKQQRLAALRADTSGGHQVEIAQLEKEIAEDQQNYRNSLEDQLLDRLQQQADLAAEQRERQIELQEMLVDSVNNIQQVNEWMNRAKGLSKIEDEDERNAAIEELKEEIREGYYSKNNYNNVTEAEQGQIKTDFEQFFNGLITNQQKQKELTNAINDLTDVLETLDNLIKEQTLTLSNAKERGYGINDAQKKFGASLSELRDIGGYTMHDFILGGYSYQNMHDAGFTPEEFASKDIAYEIARSVGYSIEQLMGVDQYHQQAANEQYELDKAEIARIEKANEIARTEEKNKIEALNNYDETRNRYVSNGALSASELAKLVELGKNPYVNKDVAKIASDLHSDVITWVKILTAAKKAGYTENQVKTWSNSKGFKEALKNWSKYETGGLANFTGPAWLDGTPSKPELVLNSTDTRNFIALRDILSKAMSSNNSTENSYANTEFNININVEKVADDYDVDKIITKVKKEVIKSANYRNVTQVRSFR